ncbi:MAG: hypothetical protein ACO2ZP_07345 [Bacteriovoracaceae bacterium]
MEKKREVVTEDLLTISPFLKVVIGYFEAYAIQYNLPIVCTSLKSDLVEGRTSSVHSDGRGADFSARSWPSFHIYRIQAYLNKKFLSWGTRPANSGLHPRVCVVHDSGTGTHFHLQVKRSLFLTDVQ